MEKEIQISRYEVTGAALKGVDDYMEELKGHTWNAEFVMTRCLFLVNQSVAALYRRVKYGPGSIRLLDQDEKAAVEKLCEGAMEEVYRRIDELRTTRERERMATQISATAASSIVREAASRAGLPCAVSTYRTRMKVSLGLTGNRSLYFTLGYKAAARKDEVDSIMQLALKMKESVQEFGHGMKIV